MSEKPREFWIGLGGGGIRYEQDEFHDVHVIKYDEYMRKVRAHSNLAESYRQLQQKLEAAKDALKLIAANSRAICLQLKLPDAPTMNNESTQFLVSTLESFADKALAKLEDEK